MNYFYDLIMRHETKKQSRLLEREMGEHQTELDWLINGSRDPYFRTKVTLHQAIEWREDIDLFHEWKKRIGL